ncbi:MAG TPA: NTP transferase domain-containing protein [Candidatus Limnocylindrales bacterium]|jgi:NDP-sugar pyrophosphorylase family protein
MTRRAVILAAGYGGRLGPLTQNRPKSLVPVNGRPLIEHVLDSVRLAGIQEVMVVLGHHGDQVRAHLGDGRYHGLAIGYAWNEQYHLGNASSLWAALPLVAHEPFLLLMADHLVSVSLLQTVLGATHSSWRSLIAIDRSDLGPEATAEATKVALEGGHVTNVGKAIEHWDACDTGVSHWLPGIFTGVSGAMFQGELGAFAANIAALGGLTACDVTGHFWLDVDTPEELALAERYLAANERLLA